MHAPPSRPVTPANWQQPDLIRWSFCHVDQILPTVTIPADSESVVELPIAPLELRDLPVPGPSGQQLTVGKVVGATQTDGWLVLHRGRVVLEEYLGGMTSASRHLLQSVSKSVVSTVVGALVTRGVIDPKHAVAEYVPELTGSGYGSATVRQLLDMRSGIGFREDYDDPRSDSRMLEALTGWAPLPEGVEPSTLRSFIGSLRHVRPHGGVFEYRSSETDVLGLVCQGATSRAFPELAAELVWSPIGAETDAQICVDAEGTAVFDGGICATVRDVARLGSVMISEGVALTGRQVVSAAWVDDIFTGAPDGLAAFAPAAAKNSMPGGLYRSQFWIPQPGGDVALAVGIHGQLIYLDRCLDLVGVKLSSWPEPENLKKLGATRAMFAAIGRHLASRD